MEIKKSTDLDEVSGQMACNVYSNIGAYFTNIDNYTGMSLFGAYTSGVLETDQEWVIVSGLASCAAFIVMKDNAYFAAHLGGDENALKRHYKEPTVNWIEENFSRIGTILVRGGSPNNDEGLAEEWGAIAQEITGAEDANIHFYLGVEALAVRRNGVCGMPNSELIKTRPGNAERQKKCVLQ